MTDDLKLSFSEKRDIVIQAGINAIPYIGGSLSSIYFGAKQERRFKRIENFYNELHLDLEKTNEKLIDLENVNPDEIAGLIEEINEGIEKDFITEKKQYFKNCFLNILTDTTKVDYRIKKYFISTLSFLNEADIEVLVALFKAPNGSGYQMQKEESFGEFNSSLEKLKSYGFANSSINGTLSSGVNWGEISLYKISEFGRQFCDFCLNSPINNEP